MSRFSRFAPYSAMLALPFVLAACGSDEQQLVDILDPNAVQYGKSYPEWAAEWVAYVDRVAPPDCADPRADLSGASCGLYQDDASPVFFLVGSAQDDIVRDACRVPHGKALFFPLVEAHSDNAGVPSELLQSDEALALEAATNFGRFSGASLRLSVDGQRLGRLDRGALVSAPYSVALAANENRYVCAGMTDVAGEFAGYLSGYWAMLPALTSGPHSIAFRATGLNPDNTEFTLDVRYELTVE